YYALAVTEQAATNRTFELGGPEAVTWNEFWQRLKGVLGKRRPSVHVPFAAMRLQATVTERLPGAPVTRDQLTMLALGDNVVTDPGAVETFQLPLVSLDEQLRRATCPAAWSTPSRTLRRPLKSSRSIHRDRARCSSECSPAGSATPTCTSWRRRVGGRGFRSCSATRAPVSSRKSGE